MVATNQKPERKRASRKGKPDGMIYDAKMHPEMISVLRKEGLSEEKIAEKLGITRETIIDWKKKYKKVAEAIGDPLPTGAESGYESFYHPKVVEYMRKLGKTVDQICKELKIHKDTYYEWAKAYPEFKAATAINKSPVDGEMLDNLVKLAKGYTIKKTRTIYEYNTKGNDKDGKPIREEVLVRKEILEEEVPPNAAAIKSWLTNRDPENWTETGRELTLNIKSEGRELTAEEKTMQDVIKAIPVADAIKMEKIITKMPAEITMKWVQSGDIKVLGEYIVDHPELIEILNENNQEEKKNA